MTEDKNEQAWQICDHSSYDDGEWLVDPNGLHYSIEQSPTVLNVLTQERDRYSAALRYYADREIYFHDDGKCSLACEDEGDQAREALADHEEMEGMVAVLNVLTQERDRYKAALERIAENMEHDAYSIDQEVAREALREKQEAE